MHLLRDLFTGWDCIINLSSDTLLDTYGAAGHVMRHVTYE